MLADGHAPNDRYGGDRVTREPVYVPIEEAARRRAERLRNTPPQPAPTPPAPILPPVEQYPEPEPRSLIADMFVAFLTLISRRTP